MEKYGYKIADIVGAGTFGTVYKCIDGNNNVCCIKRIQLNKASGVAADMHLEMIQQEIYLLQNLMHPRVISFYGYFYTSDNKYIHIVMEYATHGALSKLIAERLTEKKPLDESKIKKYLIDILLGIEYLHMKNVIHKDLKPCNILMCDNERMKIADFGVSKITNIDSCSKNEMLKQNKVKEAGGSPIYMAPETLIHNHFTFASDIWALGCILYEMCMLQAAFGFVNSMDELIRCTLTKEMVLIDPNIHPYSKELVSLCDWMMKADANQRATIKDVISSSAIVVDFYQSYFQFNA